MVENYFCMMKVTLCGLVSTGALKPRVGIVGETDGWIKSAITSAKQ